MSFRNDTIKTSEELICFYNYPDIPFRIRYPDVCSKWLLFASWGSNRMRLRRRNATILNLFTLLSGVFQWGSKSKKFDTTPSGEPAI